MPVASRSDVLVLRECWYVVGSVSHPVVPLAFCARRRTLLQTTTWARGAYTQLRALLIPNGLWPMMRPGAVTDATHALRCRGWHEVRVDLIPNGLWPMMRRGAVTDLHRTWQKSLWAGPSGRARSAARSAL
eukprot:2986925-Prymnesium_polylepis.3